MAVINLASPTREIASRPVFPGAAVAITPSDADTFNTHVTVYVGTAGDVSVLPANGNAAVTFVGLAAGSILLCQVRAVRATGTTAGSLVAVY